MHIVYSTAGMILFTRWRYQWGITPWTSWCATKAALTT